MIVKNIMDELNLKLAAGASGLNKTVEGGYACDLLSWVMAHAKSRDIWITIQTHPNVVAVAALVDISCIIIPENAQIEDETIKKADENSIPILVSSLSSFEICSKINDIYKEC